MAAVYKRKQDQHKKRACWYIGYTDHNGKRCTRKGFTDKGETERLGAKLEHDVMLRKRGLIDPAQEKATLQRRVLLVEHLGAFEKSLGKNTSKHTQLTMSRIRRIIDGCGFQTIADVTVETVEAFLVDRAAEEDLGNRTYNHYVQAFDSFCNWMVATRRVASNPLLGMERLNTEVDIRHQRRALTPDELGRLVRAARDSGVEVQCFDGETRARIYILSYMTGLRKNELASLTPSSFRLDSDPATVTVEAAISKRRRRDVLPLHPELVVALPQWLDAISLDEPLFPNLARRKTWLMIQKDLERAGIPYRTPDGVADFHAAGRHSHITELLRNGASLPEARQLARHSDIKMTMRYTHIGMADQAKAIRCLPPVRSDISPAATSTRSASAPMTEATWERPGSAEGVVGCQNTSCVGTLAVSALNNTTPAGGRGCHVVSLSDSESQQWRRRESNPRPVTVW